VRCQIDHSMDVRMLQEHAVEGGEDRKCGPAPTLIRETSVKNHSDVGENKQQRAFFEQNTAPRASPSTHNHTNSALYSLESCLVRHTCAGSWPCELQKDGEFERNTLPSILAQNGIQRISPLSEVRVCV
jgi:hypothetical protein